MKSTTGRTRWSVPPSLSLLNTHDIQVFLLQVVCNVYNLILVLAGIMNSIGLVHETRTIDLGHHCIATSFDFMFNSFHLQCIRNIFPGVFDPYFWHFSSWRTIGDAPLERARTIKAPLVIGAHFFRF